MTFLSRLPPLNDTKATALAIYEEHLYSLAHMYFLRSDFEPFRLHYTSAKKGVVREKVWPSL
jgi:hypothetical protein